MALEDLLISTGVDQLIKLVKEKGRVELALASRELVVWVPEPFSGLAAALLGEPMDLPVRGLLISASPVAGDPGQPGGYEATVVFLMEDSGSARVYRPVLRLAWQGIARLLFGEAADAATAAAATAASFTADGDRYIASGVRLPGAASLGASAFGAWLKGFAHD